MTIICRLSAPEHTVGFPEITYEMEDGFLTIKCPNEYTILDTLDLCQYLRCRQTVVLNSRGHKLAYCKAHSDYLKMMQKRKYVEHKSKNELGICANAGCTNSRSHTKRNVQKLGLYCKLHAEKRNISAKETYRRKQQEKPPKQIRNYKGAANNISTA